MSRIVRWRGFDQAVERSQVVSPVFVSCIIDDTEIVDSAGMACFLRSRRISLGRTPLPSPIAIGLVTGSQPFAGLPSNPAELVLKSLDGVTIQGIRIVTLSTPVSLAKIPPLLTALVESHRPVFVLALGLALGAPIVSAETIAMNMAHFAMSDNEEVRPTGGLPFDAEGPAARKATWDAEAVVSSIMDQDIPARLSFHAGTHLCNLTLYTYLGALAKAGLTAPCGFLHLPYLPEHIVWLMRNRADAGRSAPGVSFDIPSMPLETQRVAVMAAIDAMARQATRTGAGETHVAR